MLRRISSIFIAILILTFVFSCSEIFAWPFGKKNESSSKASAVSVKASSPKLSAQSAESDDEEVPEEPGEEAPLVPQLPQIPKLPTVPATKFNVTGGVPGVPTQGVPADALGQDPEILKIKTQIQDIIKINEGLKSNYAGQAAEIQKISEQAKIHQRILKDLETAKAQQQAARAGSEKFLNEEKIRLIQRETEKNQKFLDTLQSQDVSKNVKPIPMQEQEARKS